MLKLGTTWNEVQIGLPPLNKKTLFIGLPYQGEDIVFRFIREYNSLRDFGP
jgi:hypothetical protein